MKIMIFRGGQGRPRSFPSSVSGYQLPTLSKSQSHYSVHSGVMMVVMMTLMMVVMVMVMMVVMMTLMLMVIDNLIEYDLDDEYYDQ